MSVATDLLKAAARLGERTEDARLAGDVFPTFRRSDFKLRWFATRMHTFLFVIDLSMRPGQDLPALANEARTWARQHKGGRPAGMQTGSTAMPIFITPDAAQVAAWAGAPQAPMFAVGLFPVVISPDGLEVAYRRRTQLVGFSYESFRRSLAAQLVSAVHPGP
jgi:hypothetical protein